MEISIEAAVFHKNRTDIVVNYIWIWLLNTTYRMLNSLIINDWTFTEKKTEKTEEYQHDGCHSYDKLAENCDK